MPSQPSWRPDVQGSESFAEKISLLGTILSAVAYGVNLSLFILIIPLLVKRLKVDIKQNGRASRLTICLLIFVCVTFILSTLAMASQVEVTQLSFIDNRDFPRGPASYQESISIPIKSLGNCCFVMMNWFSDSLLFWRCLVVYGSLKSSARFVMAIPALMLLASFVAGTIFLEKITRASSLILLLFEFIYVEVTLSLNIVLTFMIVIRLYLHRRRFTKLLGRRHTSHYTGIISMLIESEAVVVVMGCWFLIPYATGKPLVNFPVFSISQAQTAASYMIIFRVAQGTAWTSETANSEFTTPDIPEDARGLSNIRFQTASVENPTDSLVTSRSRNQFPLDGLRDPDVEHSTVDESSPRDPTDAPEKARPT